MNFDELVALGGAWAWANFGKEVVGVLARRVAMGSGRKIKQFAEANWSELEWKTAARKYRQKIQELYGTTRILGKPNPITLEGIFTDVWMYDQPTALTRFDISKLRTDPKILESSVGRVNGLELVKQTEAGDREKDTGRRLFILGRPGAGKTTFLRYITLQAANGTLNRIPMFVSLKDWADSNLGLALFLCKQFQICGFSDPQPFVEFLLEQGHALVMFDGLDEVTQELRRESLIGEIRDFSNQFSNAQCLITCRIAATQYIFDKYTYVEIADFTEEQTTIFAEKWFADQPKKLLLFNEQFNDPINKGLRELGKVPLLLSLLCLSFEETLEFPRRRAEIYEEALDALLKKWDASRSIQRYNLYHEMTSGRKRQMLSRVATKSFQLNEYFIPQQKLVQYISEYLKLVPGLEARSEIDGEGILKAVEEQHGILVERAHRIYSFSHLSLQEYLTAKYICENASRDVLAQLLRVDHLLDLRWREVILITASLIENADGFFKLFHQGLDSLIENDEVLAEAITAFASTADNKPQARQMIRLLYYTIITRLRKLDILARTRYGEYSMLDQIFRDTCASLGVQFPVPIVRLASKGGSTRIVNLDHILSLIGPRMPASLSNFETDLNLIYMLLISEQFPIDTLGANSEDVKRLNFELIRFFDSVLNSTIEDKSDAATWRRLMDNEPTFPSPTILEFLLGLIPKIREDANALTSTRINRLKDYIYCSDFFLECLQLAVVSDRKTIAGDIRHLQHSFSALRVSS